MADDRTVPVRNVGEPVRGVRVEVRSGPGRGASAAAVNEVITIGSAAGNTIVVADPTVSRFHLSLVRRGDRIAVTDHGSTNGTIIGSVLVRAGTVDVAARTQLSLGQTSIEVSDDRVVVVDQGPTGLGDLRGRSAPMRKLIGTVARVAASDVAVLVLGESGTGKELVARAIHDHGERSQGPFVTVDCGAIAPALFASELFGHERGAFTGAERQHAGAFERASGGTIFLDEIGELSAELQSALLGVLERGLLRRVGGSAEIEVDARVVCATHRDLCAAVNDGSFRLDLFYRLAVVRLTLPPLRERREDIPALVEHFLREEGYDGPVDRIFDERALDTLMTHHWPGNVRELRNVVAGALALGNPPEIVGSSPGSTDPTAIALGRPYREARRLVLDAFEQRYVAHVLSRAGGNVRQAARETGMDRKYLAELMRRHGVKARPS